MYFLSDFKTNAEFKKLPKIGITRTGVTYNKRKVRLESRKQKRMRQLKGGLAIAGTIATAGGALYLKNRTW